MESIEHKETQNVPPPPKKDNRPIIAILAQPTSSDPPLRPFGKNYIPASYVKWVESAGARVVPLQFDADEETLKKIFDSVNGLLLPGGDVNLEGSEYQDVTLKLYEWAVEANDKGDYFPIWGTCQGFEQMAVIAAGNDFSILTHFDAEDVTSRLDFTEAAKKSRLFGSMRPDVMQLFTRNISEDIHEWGISPADFEKRKIAETYDILSTTPDENGKVYVSVFEAKKYPFYGVQFHPERNAFEWDSKEPIIHSAEAVEAMQALVSFFVCEARKSGHSFNSTQEEAKALIYNYAPRRTVDVDRYYEQCYFF